MRYLLTNARNEIRTQNKYKIKSEKRLENKPVSFFYAKNTVSKLIKIHSTENCRLQQIVEKANCLTFQKYHNLKVLTPLLTYALG